jgi:hypothetical protein
LTPVAFSAELRNIAFYRPFLAVGCSGRRPDFERSRREASAPQGRGRLDFPINLQYIFFLEKEHGRQAPET